MTTPHEMVPPAFRLGRIGVWSASVRFAPQGAGLAAAKELEDLGYGACWIPGGVDSGVLESIEQLLAATSSITLATGILNIWKHGAGDVAAWWAALSSDQQARVVLGLGVSHGALIGDAYQKPLPKMAQFLDALESAGLPPNRTCLAAMGPKMLELARDRTVGSCPFLTSPRHTAMARKILGGGPVLAPEQGVILETNPETARAIARELLQGYSALPNYTNSWLREGFTETDIQTLSDSLVDGLIAWGSLSDIQGRIQEHLDAGANHVCLQVIGQGGMARPVTEDLGDWRALASLL